MRPETSFSFWRRVSFGKCNVRRDVVIETRPPCVRPLRRNVINHRSCTYGVQWARQRYFRLFSRWTRAVFYAESSTVRTGSTDGAQSRRYVHETNENRKLCTLRGNRTKGPWSYRGEVVTKPIEMGSGTVPCHPYVRPWELHRAPQVPKKKFISFKNMGHRLKNGCVPAIHTSLQIVCK